MVDKVIGLFVAFVGLTAVAVIVSKRSNTAAVLNSLLNGIANLQKAAVSPVTK
jgi:hypothetical protein